MHEITVNHVQSLSRYCQISIQETQGDKLISESGPEVEPEPDDHLGQGSGTYGSRARCGSFDD